MPRAICLCLLFTALTGCPKFPTVETKKPKEGAQPAVEQNAPPGQAAAPAAAAPQPGFSQLEWKLVDKRKALADNPALIEVENKINAGDPLTAASQSYFNLGSRANILNFQHNLQIWEAAEGRKPTFDEFNTMFKQANADLKGLYPWQVYAYDDQDGSICVLEDHAEKKRLYEAQGLKLE